MLWNRVCGSIKGQDVEWSCTGELFDGSVYNQNQDVADGLAHQGREADGGYLFRKVRIKIARLTFNDFLRPDVGPGMAVI